MSIEVVARALDAPVGGNEKIVLLGLANHADPDGANAWPSLGTLARYGHCSRATVRRALRRLVVGGWIVEDGEGPRGTVRYRLILRGFQNGTGGGTTGDAGGVPPLEPEPSIEPSLSTPPNGGAPAEGQKELLPDPTADALKRWFVGLVAERRAGREPRVTKAWDRPARELAVQPRGEFKAVVVWALDNPYWFRRISTLPKLAQAYPDLRAEAVAAMRRAAARPPREHHAPGPARDVTYT